MSITFIPTINVFLFSLLCYMFSSPEERRIYLDKKSKKSLLVIIWLLCDK